MDQAQSMDWGAAGMPIACSLTPEEFQVRRAELWPDLVEQADAVTPLEDGYQLRFMTADVLVRRIGEMIELERTCCPFLDFDVNVDAEAGSTTLSITGPEGTREFLTGLFGQDAQTESPNPGLTL